jgi:L-ascorbate metabolism protein UlaG (beta-lactamase superfamily)
VDAIRITHIGGPTTLIEVGSWRLLTDPTFDAPGRRYGFGWGSSSRKLRAPAVQVRSLPPIDVVLLSHDQHADNLDDAGRALLPAVGEVITTSSGARRLARNARGLAPWGTTRLEKSGAPSITVTATPCRHGPPGSGIITGEVTGFALQWKGQRHGVLWITGDTVLYDGVRQVAERCKVGTMLVHLGGVRFPVTGPLRYTMRVTDLVPLCRLMKPATAIPIHFEGWSHFEAVGVFDRELAALPPDVMACIRRWPTGHPGEVAV